MMKFSLFPLKNVYKYMRLTKNIHKIAGDKVIPLKEDTLTGRILIYLNKDAKQPNENEIIVKDDFINRRHLSKLNVNQLAKTFHVTNISKKVLNTLDNECCLRSQNLDIEDFLKLLSTYMKIIPNRITDYRFYYYAIEHLSREVEKCSKSQLIQFIFYVAIERKNKKTQALLRRCLYHLSNHFLNELTLEDFWIVCNATFKTATKINNKIFLERIKNVVSSNLCLLKDPAVFITFIKTIRHNRYQDDDLLATITYTIFFNKTFQYYSFVAVCHLLALYGDYLYYDEDLLKVAVEKCMSELKIPDSGSNRDHPAVRYRVKDLNRFLWALSNLNYKEIGCDLFKDVIVPKIQERIALGEYESDPKVLTDSILYMWILNYQAVEIIPHALQNKYVSQIYEDKSTSNLRLNLLLTCIQIENNKLYHKLNVKPYGNPHFNLESQVEKRMLLKKVYSVLKTISPNYPINKFVLNCQVPYLNLVGITGYKEKIYKAVHIEVLDDYVCVKNKDCTPFGPMELKLRILENFDEALLIMKSEEIEMMTDGELKDFLEEEIDLLC